MNPTRLDCCYTTDLKWLQNSTGGGASVVRTYSATRQNSLMRSGYSYGMVKYLAIVSDISAISVYCMLVDVFRGSARVEKVGRFHGNIYGVLHMPMPNRAAVFICS